MPVNVDTRTIESPATTEIYISAAPDQNAPADEQAQEIFSEIADTLEFSRQI